MTELRDFREKNGITQVKLASKAEIYQSRMNVIEQGYYKMNEVEKNKIIKAYEKFGIDAKEEIEKIFKFQKEKLTT